MITLGAIKSRVGKILNVCQDDSRVAEYLNRAEARLITEGKWKGTVATYRICTNDSCLTWPRQIETIEAAAICKTPILIRNQWYEFLGNGLGILDPTQADCQLHDRGLACAFDDVRWNGTTAPQLKLYADNPADAGARVLLKFFDSNGNKVYSYDTASANTIEGVYVAIVAAPAYATAMILNGAGVSTGVPYTVMGNGLYEVQKPVTKGVIRLYCYDPVLFTQYPLAYYEPSETLPEYRRSIIPGMSTLGVCAGTTTSCQQKQVTVRAKLKHIDVVVDTDSLLLSAEALCKEVEAIYLSEPPVSNEAAGAVAHAKARAILDSELANYQGDGVVQPLRFQCNSTFGAGGIGLTPSWPLNPYSS